MGASFPGAISAGFGVAVASAGYGVAVASTLGAAVGSAVLAHAAAATPAVANAEICMNSRREILFIVFLLMGTHNRS